MLCDGPKAGRTGPRRTAGRWDVTRTELRALRRVRGRRPGGGTAGSIAGPGRSKQHSFVWAAVAILLVVVGTTVSLFASAAVRRGDAERSRRAFDASSEDIASTLKLALQHEEDLVVSASGFVVGNPNASNAQLRAWATTVRASSRYPELQGLGIVVFVPRAELAAFAARAQADPVGSPGPSGKFVVLPPGDRPYYCFTQANGFAAPGLPALPAGLDLCTTVLGPAFLLTRDFGRGAYLPSRLSGVDSLIVETPVYRGGVVPATVGERRAAFLAEIGTEIAPKVLLDRALQGHPSVAVTLRYRTGSSDVAFSSGRLPCHAKLGKSLPCRA